ncbi:MAG: sigma-70 region 4 domain-containing protein [Chloroflexota bacterium]|nr:sigma-70 region 4 domain-containing protein [Chloroflexota bacterium]
MSDQPTNQRPTDHSGQSDRPAGNHRPITTDPAPVPIEEAAARLGITVNAVRQRIKRGTVEGYKTPAGWVVVVEQPTTDQGPTDRPTRSADHTTRPTSQRPTTTDQAGNVDLAPLAAVIADLTRENRQLAEAAAIWQVRAVQAEERLKQLTAGDDTPADAPSAAQEPQHGAHPVETAPDASPSWWASWWRRLTGG